MNAWKVIVATLLIFGAGLITGKLWFHVVPETSTRAIEPANPFAGNTSTNVPMRRGDRMLTMEQKRIEFMQNVSKKLDLSDEQKKQIDEIVQGRQEEIRKIWEPVWDYISPKLRAEITNAHTEISAALTEDQRAKFEELMKRPPPRRDGGTNNVSRRTNAPMDNLMKSNIVAPLGAAPDKTP